MFAAGTAPRGEAQYPSAIPSSAKGKAPRPRATASAIQRAVVSCASVVATAAIATTPAEANPNSAADSARAANRTRDRSGRTRTYRSQGDSRSVAMPTPNWKNATPSSAKPANEANRRVASAFSRGATNRRKKSAGRPMVGTLKAGSLSSVSTSALACATTSLTGSCRPARGGPPPARPETRRPAREAGPPRRCARVRAGRPAAREPLPPRGSGSSAGRCRRSPRSPGPRSRPPGATRRRARSWARPGRPPAGGRRRRAQPRDAADRAAADAGEAEGREQLVVGRRGGEMHANEVDDLADAERRREADLLRRHPDPGAGLRPAWVGSGKLGPPGVRPGEPAQERDRSRLAGPVRTEEREI